MGQWRAEVGEAEHRQRGEGAGRVEAEGAAGDQADLGVDRFDAGVGEAVLDRGDDSCALLADRARELQERLQRRASRPGQAAV
jgi:hypothetical protein